MADDQQTDPIGMEPGSLFDFEAIRDAQQSKPAPAVGTVTPSDHYMFVMRHVANQAAAGRDTLAIWWEILSLNMVDPNWDFNALKAARNAVYATAIKARAAELRRRTREAGGA